MEEKSRIERYREFTAFVRADMDSQRRLLSRKLLSVFLWCFLVPAGVSLIGLLLLRMGYLPKRWTRYLDWVILIFPILYALYVLGIEVLRDLPLLFKQGGIAFTLEQGYRNAEWRARMAHNLQAQIKTDRQTWNWVLQQFQMDLNGIHQRTKHLTALAGAVFFLLMKGIDSIGQDEVRSPGFYQGFLSIQDWFEASSDGLAQFVGLALFLVLFYLSGNQTHQSLARYRDCVELVILEQENEQNRNRR